MENKKTRSGLKVMAGLIGMVKPLLGVMAAAIFMGCLGNLMATFITILGGWGILNVLGVYDKLKLSTIFTLALLFALFRGLLRYAEQACNHYIAFKLLAHIRHKVFAALRKLAPAKLDGSDKGNLISIITSDIELLEVFYAHTISPIAIAIITSAIMTFYIGSLHPAAGLTALCFYIIVGAVIPLINGRHSAKDGLEYRNSFGDLNTCVLDNLHGLDEILQYNQEYKRMKHMEASTDKLESVNRRLKRNQNAQQTATDGVILLAEIFMAILTGCLTASGKMNGYEAMIAVIAISSSFGPTAALSSLSNNLSQTLASGNRVLDILDENPIVYDVENGDELTNDDICCTDVSFAYPNTEAKVLNGFNATFSEHKIHGVLGKSGCGKSTMLKLLMRFYETDNGTISYGTKNVNEISTASLRQSISYVTQETFLFHDTIENNIKVANEAAAHEEVVAAAKKAAIHDFIMSLPNGYETTLTELGASVSGGERQRIGLARAFLHESEIILLDEPTSNIDSLNEGIILQSLEREKQDKTIILVSHRKSTMGIADDVLEKFE